MPGDGGDFNDGSAPLYAESDFGDGSWDSGRNDYDTANDYANALLDHDHWNRTNHVVYESATRFHGARGDSAVHNYRAECGCAHKCAGRKWRAGHCQRESKQWI